VRRRILFLRKSRFLVRRRILFLRRSRFLVTRRFLFLPRSRSSSGGDSLRHEDTRPPRRRLARRRALPAYERPA
jgi:hypothetical protein